MTESWAAFLKRLKNEGFTILVDEKFVNSSQETATNIVAAHRKDKLLVHATNLINRGNEALNRASVYGCLPEEKWAPYQQVTNSTAGSCGIVKNRISFHLSVADHTERFFAKLNQVRKLGPIDWEGTNHTFVYIDGEVGWDHKKSRQRWWQFINQAPAWVKAFVN